MSFQKSRIVVDFKDQALQEAGDLQEALRTGVISADAIYAELGEVITGNKVVRENDRDITLFKSVGMAIEDIATATFAYQQALAAGIGTHIELDGAGTPAMPPAAFLPNREPGLGIGRVPAAARP